MSNYYENMAAQVFNDSLVSQVHVIIKITGGWAGKTSGIMQVSCELSVALAYS